MEDDIGDKNLMRMRQRSRNIIDSSISSHFSIINSSKRLHMINQSNELASVICDVESDRLG